VLRVGLGSNRGFDRSQLRVEIACLDEPAGSGGGADEGAVSLDRVLKGQRLDGCGLEESLGTLDAPES
jgi:hypothetical protein